MKSSLLALLAGAAVVLYAGGCGGKSASSTPPAPQAETQSGAPATAQTSAPTRPHLLLPHRRALSDYDGDDYSTTYDGGINDGDHDDVRGPVDRDGDADSGRATASYDNDDKQILAIMGQPAAPGDRRTIATLVKRYFSAAASANGAKACAMLQPALVRSIPISYGRPPGPPYSRGTTCAVVMSKMFIFHHLQIAAEAGGLQVAEVRTRGHEGAAITRVQGAHLRVIRVERDGGDWVLGALLDTELP